MLMIFPFAKINFLVIYIYGEVKKYISLQTRQLTIIDYIW